MRYRDAHGKGIHLKIYIDVNDWWVGYYRGSNHHYIVFIPTIVIRANRKRKEFK